MLNGLNGASATAKPIGSLHHPSFGLVNYEVEEISDDPDTQVAQTTAIMARYVREDAYSPEILSDAVSASSSTDPIQVAADCWSYVRGKIGFVNDDVTARPFANLFQSPIVETLVRPRDMSVACASGDCNRTGDCDDYSMYLAALLTASNIPCKFVTVAADAADPKRYSHVYVVAYINGQRIPLDSSHGQYAGWEAPNRFGKRAEWPVAYEFSWQPVLVLLASIAVLGVILK